MRGVLSEGAPRTKITPLPFTSPFPQAAVHELGHALGLRHTRVRGNVMNPIYKKVGIDELGEDDKQGIMRLYGPREYLSSFLFLSIFSLYSFFLFLSIRRIFLSIPSFCSFLFLLSVSSYSFFLFLPIPSFCSFFLFLLFVPSLYSFSLFLDMYP